MFSDIFLSDLAGRKALSAVDTPMEAAAMLAWSRKTIGVWTVVVDTVAGVRVVVRVVVRGVVRGVASGGEAEVRLLVSRDTWKGLGWRGRGISSLKRFVTVHFVTLRVVIFITTHACSASSPHWWHRFL